MRVGRFRSHWRSTMYEVIFVITGYRETMDRVGAINTDGLNWPTVDTKDHGWRRPLTR